MASRQTKFAWAMYYQQARDTHLYLRQRRTQLNQMNELINATEQGNQQLVLFVKELLRQVSVDIQCPICLEDLECDDLQFSKCGHKYCAECLKKLKETSNKCAICRKKLSFRRQNRRNNTTQSSNGQ